ncbi:RES family NAD+ phosphorylase [Deinococcus yavapaiensis]|uniref:RES domain-containing protein n=1 Tax=Deinococcus yavapaiensis KR-236 TaxID=694435 RepID=A0A318S4X6_9DEIO|nr:RES family NAD+ phosphorylase [Deinococcus yavapaiensis]PYE52040.1 RES domain-containing protein [Deinococcus yavapaiensis KR-236]
MYRLAHERALERNPHPFVPSGAPARWNSDGVRVAYTSEHPALAALELLGYWRQYPQLSGYRLFSANIDDDDIETADETVDPTDTTVTRAYGDAWAASKRSFALRVPSVVMPVSFNVLVNAIHPKLASFTYQDHGSFSFDSRVDELLQRAKTKQAP